MNKSKNQTGDFFSDLPASRQHATALFIIFIIPFFVFTATTIGGQRFLGSDSVQWRAMAEDGIEYTERTGKPALWTKNMFSGMPTYTISAVKVVPHIDILLNKVFKFLFPAYWFWVMMIGVYIFLVCLKAKPLHAVIGAILFGLTTYVPVFVGAGHNSKLVTLSFIPWVMLGYWLTAHSRKKILGLVAFSVALTLEFRAGHPQITYYFVYLLFFWWLYDTYSAFKNKETKEWFATTGFLAAGTILGLAGNAGHYWRLAEYSPLSMRGGSALDVAATGLESGYAFAWSQGILESLTLFIPNLFGGASPDYWGRKSFTSGPHYLGAIVLPFLILALAKNRKPLVLVLFGTGTLAMLFSWGGNLRWLNELAFDILPFFNKFRAPETWLILTSFCYVTVSIFGLTWFTEYVKKHKKPSIEVLYIPFGTALALALVFTLFSSSILSFEKAGEQQAIAQQIAAQNNVNPQNPQVQNRARQYVQTQLVPDRRDKAQTDALRFLLLTALAGGLCVALIKNKVPVSGFSFALIVLVAFDMISVDKRYIADSQRADENFDLAAAVERQKLPTDEFIEDHAASGEGYAYRTLNLERNTFNSAIASYFYPTIGGYNGAKLSIYQDMIEQNGPLFSGSSGLNLDVLAMLNARYIVYNAGLQLPGLNQVFRQDRLAVYENERVLPKAFFVDSVVYAETPREAYNFLSTPGFVPSRYAVVETSVPIRTEQDTTAEVRVTEYDNHLIKLKINRTRPGFLVLSEVYYPQGWVASIDGGPVPIIKTNYVLRGIEVPPGEHEVTFRFKPASFVWGSRIEWTSNITQWGLAAFILIGFFRRKNQKKYEA